MNAPLPSRPSPARANPIRVIIVDDSAVVRGMMARWLEPEPDIAVVGYAADGDQAIKRIADTPADVCLLDIEMPKISGLEALPALLASQPRLRVIMASTLTERGAAVTLQALQLGAADFLPKPTSTRLGGAEDYRRDLLAKIRQFAPRTAPTSSSARLAAPSRTPMAGGRAAARGHLEAMVIAASTGGPQALRTVIASLGSDWSPPILIAQHMPAQFTRTLAEMLAKCGTLSAKEAEDGEPLRPRWIYVAPGGYHLTVYRNATGGAIARLDQGPEVNWCRPSADPLFQSAARIWGANVLGVVLTGMGHDGRDGALALRAAGGLVIAQDEATSTVWGMPGAVVEAGAADRVAPLSQVGVAALELARGVAP